MATEKQKQAAQRNVRKAQAVWAGMTHRQRALAQPQGRSRKKPGTTGKGKFYRIILRPKEQFSSFRIQDVGVPGGLERVAGRRPSGSWDTQAWLVSKDDAHVEGGQLIIDDTKAQSVLHQIEGPLEHVSGDVWRGHVRNVREKDKPTPAMRRAQMENIAKAQQARRK